MKGQIDWKQELLDSANFNSKQEKILKYVPKSLPHSWILGALNTRWEKLKGIREKPVADCSSSFQEWNKKVEDVEKCQS